MTDPNLNPPLSPMAVVALLTTLTLELVRSTGALLEVAFRGRESHRDDGRLRLES